MAFTDSPETKPAPLKVRLKTWRIGKRWTRSIAAEFLNVPLRTYEKWERGETAPQGLGKQALEKLIIKAGNLK